MPAPVKAEKKNDEPEVKVIPSPEIPQQEKIVLDAETGKPIDTSTPPQTPDSREDIRKMEARLAYELRKQRQEFEQTLQRLVPQQTPAAKPAEPDPEFDQEMDALAKTNYQKAIKLMAAKQAEEIAEKKFKSMMEQRDRESQVSFQKQQTTMQLEREKSWVLEKTPKLNDESSEEFQGYYATYNRMVSEDPSLVSNPRAPRLVWYEWKSAADEKPAQNTEAERLKRVAAGQVPQGRSLPGKKTIQLTQDEIDFCKNNKLSPARYAEMKEANFKEGVTA